MDLLDIQQVFAEKDSLSSGVAKQVRQRFPDAKIKLVNSHWQIPEIHGNQDLANDRYVRVKKNFLILGEKKKLYCRENGRSTDFIAPSHSNGCAMACAYCVPAGTMISTPDGLVPAEQIQESDLVLSYNSSSGQLEASPVGPLSSREVDEIYEIEVDDKVLQLTAEHPVYTRRGWVEAQHLTENDEVLNVGT